MFVTVNKSCGGGNYDVGVNNKEKKIRTGCFCYLKESFQFRQRCGGFFFFCAHGGRSAMCLSCPLIRFIFYFRVRFVDHHNELVCKCNSSLNMQKHVDRTRFLSRIALMARL